MEALSILIDEAVKGGFLSSFSIRGREGENVQTTHLLFADGTQVFCKDTCDHLVHLNWILMWFEALSGLKINLRKSAIYPVGVCGESGLSSLRIGLRCWVSPNNLLRVTSRCKTQLPKGVGWGRGEVQEKASPLEASIYLQRRKTTHLKHPF